MSDLKDIKLNLNSTPTQSNVFNEILQTLKFKNRKVAGEELPDKICEVIILLRNLDFHGSITIHRGTWTPYFGPTSNDANLELNENGFQKYPSKGYLGTVNITSRIFKGEPIMIGFHAWEQNNSEFILWKKFDTEEKFLNLQTMFNSLNLDVKKKFYDINSK